MIEAGIKAAWKVGKTDAEKLNIDRAVLSTYRVKVPGGEQSLHAWIQDKVTDALDAVSHGGYSAGSQKVEDQKNAIVKDALAKLGIR